MKKIFVSSTFNDMMSERDIIQNEVAPYLNSIAGKYGDYVQFCDLRWGVDTTNMTEEEASRKVVDSCFSAINHCKPYIVGIIGDRYGWVIDDELYQTICARYKIKAGVDNPSVTALEIEYAAMSGLDENVSALFYKRVIVGDVPDEIRKRMIENTEHVQELVDYISKRYTVKNYYVKWNDETKSFDGIDEFAKMLKEDMLSLMSPEWEAFEEKSGIERKLILNAHRYEHYLEGSCGNSNEIDFLKKQAKENSVVVITGEEGCGKTSLACMVLRMVEGKKCPVFCGLDKELASAASLRDYIIELGKLLGYRAIMDVSKEDEYVDVMSFFESQDQEYYFLFDDIEELKKDDDLEQLVFIPYRVPENVHFIIATNNPELVNRMHFPYCIKERSVGFLKSISEQILRRMDKSIDSDIISMILENTRKHNALYISLIIHRLSILQGNHLLKTKGNDAINDLLKNMVLNSAVNTEELCIQLLEDAVFALEIKGMYSFLKYVAVSAYPLKYAEAALFVDLWTEDSVSMLDYEIFKNYLSEYIEENDEGGIKFKYAAIKRAILNSISEEEETQIINNLHSYYRILREEDKEEGYKLFYYGVKSGNTDTIASLLIEDVDNEDLSVKKANVWIDLLKDADVDSLENYIDLFFTVFSHPKNREHAQVFARFVLKYIGRDNTNAIYDNICEMFHRKNLDFARKLHGAGDIDELLLADIIEKMAEIERKYAKLYDAAAHKERAWELLCEAYNIYKEKEIINTDVEKRVHFYRQMADYIWTLLPNSEDNLQNAGHLYNEILMDCRKMLTENPNVNSLLHYVDACNKCIQFFSIVKYINQEEILSGIAEEVENVFQKYRYIFKDKELLYKELSLTLHMNMCESLSDAEAIPKELECISEAEELLNANHIEIRRLHASCCANIGRRYWNTKKFEEAEHFYYEAMTSSMYIYDRIYDISSIETMAKRTKELLELQKEMYLSARDNQILARLRTTIELAIKFNGQYYNMSRTSDKLYDLWHVLMIQLDFADLKGEERLKQLQNVKEIMKIMRQNNSEAVKQSHFDNVEIDAGDTFIAMGEDAEKIDDSQHREYSLLCYEQAIGIYMQLITAARTPKICYGLTQALLHKARHPEGKLRPLQLKNLKTILALFDPNEDDEELQEAIRFVESLSE